MDKFTFVTTDSKKTSSQFVSFLWIQTLIIILAILSTGFCFAMLDFLFSSPLEEYFGDFFTEWIPMFLSFTTCTLWFLIDYKVLNQFLFPSSKNKPFLFIFSWNIAALIFAFVLTMEHYLGLMGAPFNNTDIPIIITMASFIFGYMVFLLSLFFLFKYIVFNDDCSIKITFRKD